MPKLKLKLRQGNSEAMNLHGPEWKMAPKIGDREVVYQDPYQRIYRVSADFGAFRKEYFVRDTGHRAGILVLDKGSVLLVRQYRLLINGVSFEIPGGKVEEGETPEAAASRECLEEAGIHCRNLRHLMNFHPGLDSLHNPTHIIYTEDWNYGVNQVSNHSETTSSVWVPLQEAVAKVFGEEIVDALSIVALLSYSAVSEHRHF